jgi:hypothetical protein
MDFLEAQACDQTELVGLKLSHEAEYLLAVKGRIQWVHAHWLATQCSML